MKNWGWAPGRTVRIDYRFAIVDADRARSSAAKLVALAPDAILPHTPAMVVAPKQATDTIPIVFVQVLIERFRVVTGLSHPSGNVTGFVLFATVLGRQVVTIPHRGVTEDSTSAGSSGCGKSSRREDFLRSLQAVASSPRVSLESTEVRDASYIERAVNAIAAHPDSGLIVFPSPIATAQRELIINLAARHRLPAVYPFRFFVTAGGLMCYGANISINGDKKHRMSIASSWGKNPADIPVAQPTKFELVINLKTAKALGLDAADAARPRRRGDRVKRREFITLLGGAAAAWPLAVHAQLPSRMRHVGVFLGLTASADDPGAGEILRPFKAAMAEAGWIEDQNIRLDYRFGGGDLAKIHAAAGDLVTLAPDLIYATGLPPAQALRQRTRTIPIVFSLVADPVGFGLVESLRHPGGNITGFVVWDLSIGGKWMQLLQEIAPNLRRIGIMYNPDTAPYAPSLVASAKAAAVRDVAVLECFTHNDSEIEAAASLLGNEPLGGLLVIPEPFTNARRDLIIAQSARFKLPSLNPAFGAASRGALISYTFAFERMMRQPVTYIDRILRGELPNGLPVQTPDKFVLAINLAVAKALGITVPPTLLALADQVIE